MGAGNDLIDAIPHDRAGRAQPSATKYARVDEFFGHVLGEPVERVYTAGVSKPGNVKVRATQSPRARAARYLVLVVEDGHDKDNLARSVTAATQLVAPGGPKAVIVVAESTAAGNDWEVRAVVEPDGGPVLPLMAAKWPNVKRHDPAPLRESGPGPTFVVPLSMDEATARMARLAIVTSPAVLLVGPPGTGKNRLLNDILDDIRADPTAYNFTKAREALIEPAEEGWTTRDLVGGETLDETRNVLRFRPGKVLDAIANDRWLIIDEANRADLDRIFGGLLTWLSRQTVVVGRASTKVGAPLVRLGWSDGPDSRAIGAERLAEDDVGSEPIDYLAGSEFRLLGTYNALDAQRVFRFGLALGRRFAQVPVPPASVEDFALLVEAAAADIEDQAVRDYVIRSVAGLYAAHHRTPGARLGPAMFLSIPEYVSAGLTLADLVELDPKSAETVDQLIAEAYLLSTGSWLARLDEHTELSMLGQHLTLPTEAGKDPVMHAGLWAWITGQLATIGG